MSHPAAVRKCGGSAVIIMNGRLMCITEIKGPVAFLVGSGNGNKSKYAQSEKEYSLFYIQHVPFFVASQYGLTCIAALIVWMLRDVVLVCGRKLAPNVLLYLFVGGFALVVA